MNIARSTSYEDGGYPNVNISPMSTYNYNTYYRACIANLKILGDLSNKLKKMETTVKRMIPYKS